MNARAYVIRSRDTTFQRCGFGGCTSLAPFVLMAGGKPQLYCCAQCASVGVRAVIFSKVVGAPPREVVVLKTAAEARDYLGHDGASGFFFPARITVVHMEVPASPTITVRATAADEARTGREGKA